MQKEEKLLLTSISKDDFFNSALEKLTRNESLNENDKTFLLGCSIMFLRCYQENPKLTGYADFSYYLILKYSLVHKDYVPLYDFAINFGFYPISKAILENNLVGYSIGNCLYNFNHNRFVNESKYVETIEQHVKTKSFLDDSASEKSYLAPTSFGKSSIIINYIQSFTGSKKIAIIVPTRSLLVQTHQMIRNANLGAKIITHDEMFDNESSFIAVFTQERALRLLVRFETFFDALIIDEAHNLLKKDGRSILLSRLISKNRALNKKQKVVYLSPLVSQVDNLKIHASQKINSHVIQFNVKEPDIYELKTDGQYIYNRFTNQFFKISASIGKFKYVVQNSTDKNFIYSYSPVKVERLAEELSKSLKEIKSIDAIKEIESILKKEVHKEFYGIRYLKYGLVYLHGKLPDLIKAYLEYKFRTVSHLKYIIANSVILEGINLPIDSLFIFNTRGLQGKELINLIGRVNRLNNIFSVDEVNLQKLIPNIHFVNSAEYNGERSNMANKIRLLRSRIFDDLVENPVLDSFDIDKLKLAKEKKKSEVAKIETILSKEKFIATKTNSVVDVLKIRLIESGISEFYKNLDVVTEELSSRINLFNSKGKDIWSARTVMEKIYHLFIRAIKGFEDFEIKRLRHVEARKYYQNFIQITQKQPLNQAIVAQRNYFRKKAKSDNPLLYIGTSYGEVPMEPDTGINNAIDLKRKKNDKLINIAIVKLKMEEDFVSFKLNKFIVLMYDYKLITKDEYNQYIYGTTDEAKISLTKYGLSVSLISRLERDKQLGNIYFDDFNNLKGNEEFLQYMQSVDDFYRFEISRYLN